jgi:hypothetical protein
MITPAYSTTATERVLPRLALDFTTAVTDPRVATARAGNTATRTNSSGVIEIVNANLPRYDFSPTTLVCLGQLVEESRANLFLNSLINGTSLSTQIVVVTAVAHTISFYGTGTITLSGAATATVTGTGAYPNRQKLTFTPIVGGLICTVTGSVQYAQLEIGGFATSFIPTAATSVTRNADAVSMTGTNFSSWFNQTEGAFSIICDTFATGTVRPGILINKTSAASGYIYFKTPRPPGTTGITIQSDAGAIIADLSGSAITVNTQFTVCGAYKTNSFAFADRGAAPTTDASGTTPSGLDRMGIGYDFGTTYQNGHIAKIMYWQQRLTDAEVQAFSK